VQQAQAGVARAHQPELRDRHRADRRPRRPAGRHRGALVGQGTATLLTTVEQIDPIYVNFDQPAVDIETPAPCANAGSVTVAHDQMSVQPHAPRRHALRARGTLDFLDVSVDPATGAVALRGILPNPEHQLLPACSSACA